MANLLADKGPGPRVEAKIPAVYGIWSVNSGRWVMTPSGDVWHTTHQNILDAQIRSTEFNGPVMGRPIYRGGLPLPLDDVIRFADSNNLTDLDNCARLMMADYYAVNISLTA